MPTGYYKRSPEQILFLKTINIGRKRSVEEKRIISLNLKGNHNTKGQKRSKAFKEICRKRMIGKKYALGVNLGEKHWNWKGNKALYGTIHDWIQYHLGKPTKCINCGKTEGKFTWASISHEVKRDLKDYIPLCYKCHFWYDKRNMKININKLGT